MKLKEETKNRIIEIQGIYPHKRSALIPALHLAQADYGYLPLSIQSEVAELFDLKINEVQSVVTFYDMFYEEPVGKHLIHVCKNVSCMLRGSDELIDQLCAHLKVNPDQKSENEEFTLIPSECLGACDRAPLLLIDDEVFGPIKEGELEKIIAAARTKTAHSCPVEIRGKS